MDVSLKHFSGVPDENAIDEYGIRRWVESHRIFASGLIVSAYTEQYSHWNAVESLSSWLKRHNVPGLYGQISFSDLRLFLKRHVLY